VPLVEGVKYDISYDEAYEMMLKALSPLGEDYVSQLKEMKVAGVIDVHETPGKRSGAYNIGVYGVHPYVLLNHRNDLDSLFTLTHEMGHAMHSYYSNKHQPHITAGYSIFVAEVASTVNEVLLMHHLIDHEKDDKKRRYLLHHFIDQFKGTFFTQVMFAEFEKIVHEKAEKEEPLNASAFNEVYEELFGSYHGESLELGDEVKYGWSRIPHFYRPFYVYKYATGYASAIHIADRLLKGDEETKNNYLEFLKSGSSDYPLNLLKRTGVDLEEGEPIRNALNVFSGLVKEFSKE
jgi:oligoendopeptidase F